MAGSPLQFAKEFARLHGQLAASPPGDSQLLLVLDFWQEMCEHLSDSAFRSYFDEYLPLLIQLVEPANLADLSIAELMIVQSVLAEIQDVPELVASLEIGSKLDLVIVALARVYFYIGAVEEGLAVLSSLPSSLSSEALLDGLESTHEYVALQTICARATETNHPLAATLNDILNDWQGEREAVYHDRARCLFVERDGSGRFVRGRLRTLVGRVEMFGKSARTDEITFDNVIKTPDDPFVGVAYSALAAVRKVFRAAGLKGQGGSYYHAHFSIADSGQTFTGDSIGLAFGLLAHVQLLRPEVLRLDRLLSGEVAFTGGVDADGRLTAVNDETLGVKIERAFFSSVKYMVLPEANLPTAKQHLNRLRKSYPRRNLHLIAAERLSDLIEDHNIVRSEKVCIGEFVAKKAAKYGRMTKVQVPLLLLLGYLLVCLIYPKAWVGFDWNPASVTFVDASFEVYNKDSHLLWSKLLDCGLLINGQGLWAVADLNHSGKNDVLIMPYVKDANTHSGWIYVFDCRGDTLFSRDCVVRGEYPHYANERESDTVRYYVAVDVVVVSGRPIIVAQTYQDYPDREYIRFLDAGGRYLGWFVNAGGTNLREKADIDDDGNEELIFFGYNQLLGCSTIFALSPDSSRGVSPPYQAPELDLSWVKRGNQLRYVMFPPSDLGRHDLSAEYNHLVGFEKESESEFRASISESNLVPGSVTIDYYFDRRLRVIRARLSDVYDKRRRALVAGGLLRDTLKSVYCDALRDSITYWTGTEYVTEGQLRARGQ